MSDYDDDEESFDATPNYEKLRGMGFICWREIPATGDQVNELNFIEEILSFSFRTMTMSMLKTKEKRTRKTINEN